MHNFSSDTTVALTIMECSISFIQVVASQDWPEITKYAGVVCAQGHRVETIQDLFKTWNDPGRGTQYGGMVRQVKLE